MGYNKRYTRRRSNRGLGSAVSDAVAIANNFGPRGAFITGVAGFISFYFIVPWVLITLAEYNKGKMTGQYAALFGMLLDAIFSRRFIHPSEWVGTSILLVCVAVACWKVATRRNLTTAEGRDLSGLGKLLARLID